MILDVITCHMVEYLLICHIVKHIIDHSYNIKLKKATAYKLLLYIRNLHGVYSINASRYKEKYNVVLH